MTNNVNRQFKYEDLNVARIIKKIQFILQAYQKRSQKKKYIYLNKILSKPEFLGQYGKI